MPLLQALQPNAITMGAGIENDPNEVDWVGTESGMPEYGRVVNSCTTCCSVTTMELLSRIYT